MFYKKKKYICEDSSVKIYLHTHILLHCEQKKNYESNVYAKHVSDWDGSMVGFVSETNNETEMIFSMVRYKNDRWHFCVHKCLMTRYGSTVLCKFLVGHLWYSESTAFTLIDIMFGKKRLYNIGPKTYNSSIGNENEKCFTFLLNFASWFGESI